MEQMLLRATVLITCFLCLTCCLVLLFRCYYTSSFNVYSSDLNGREATESTAVKRSLTLQLGSLCLAGRVLSIRPVGRGVRPLRLSSGELKPSVLSH